MESDEWKSKAVIEIFAHLHIVFFSNLSYLKTIKQNLISVKDNLSKQKNFYYEEIDLNQKILK